MDVSNLPFHSLEAIWNQIDGLFKFRKAAFPPKMSFLEEEVLLKGIATILKSQVSIGYFASNNGAYKLLLSPSNTATVPSFHDCCQPPSRKEDEIDHSGHWMDLVVKQKDFELKVPLLQVVDPENDASLLTTDWLGTVQGTRLDSSSASFSPHLIKVGNDAREIQRKYFPFAKDQQEECVVLLGPMSIRYKAMML